MLVMTGARAFRRPLRELRESEQFFFLKIEKNIFFLKIEEEP